jgi:hypothetical protein
MRTILGIVIFLMAAAGIVGAGIWYLNMAQPEEPLVLDQESEANFEDEGELGQGLGTEPLASPSGELVVVENEAAMSGSEREALYTRVIEPFVDYYKDAGEGTLLSLTINQNTQDNRTTYPYLASATFDTGASMGFVVKKEGDILAWWYPECMDICPLSPEFMDKYPEIVELVNR